MRKSLKKCNAFVGHIWIKLRKDTQYLLEEVLDWAAHLEHLQSILLEFDANNALGEGQFGRIFYDGLKPSIKLLIAKIEKDIPWDDLVSAANKAKARAKIQENTHYDQQYLRRKWSLKISLNFKDNQIDKRAL